MPEEMAVISPAADGADGPTAAFGRAAGALPGARSWWEEIPVATGARGEFCDITSRVEDIIARSGVRAGFCVVFSRHTTAAVRINEAEPLLLEDIREMLERVAPPCNYYRHNDLSIRTVNRLDDEDSNGHAHCQHLLMGTSETVPVIDGRMTLGRWQRIFLVELDRPRDRRVVVQVLGV